MKTVFCAALVILALASSVHLSGDDAISITVRPSVTSFRGNAQLRVLIARNEMNRALVWELDGPNYYRSSERQLDGDRSPRSYLFTMHDLPAGEFEIRATVRRSDDSTATDRSSIRVVGGAGDPDRVQ